MGAFPVHSSLISVAHPRRLGGLERGLLECRCSVVQVARAGGSYVGFVAALEARVSSRPPAICLQWRMATAHPCR